MTVCQYLRDAGFNRNLYIMEDFDNKRNYVEVFFMCNEAVDYIKLDITTSDFKEILEIKKYRYENGICSAIITYKF